MRRIGRPARDSLLAFCVAMGSSCENDPPARNPFLLVSVGGAEDFDVTSDGRVVVASTGRIYGATSGVEIVDPDTLAVTNLNTEQAFYIDVEGDQVFASWSGVIQVPIAGGATTHLTGPWDAGTPSGVVSDGTYVFVADGGATAGGIHRHEIATGTNVTLVAPTSVWGGLVADATHVYWITHDGTIDRILASGGTKETVFDLADHPGVGTGQLWSLAVDDAFVYVGLDGSVLRFSKTTLVVELIAAEQVLARALAVDATHVYWARGHANRFVEYPGECDVVRRALAGGPEQVIARRQNGVTRISFARGRVVWNETVPSDLASVRLDEL